MRKGGLFTQKSHGHIRGLFSLVAFKGNLSLLDIFCLFQGTNMQMEVWGEAGPPDISSGQGL